MLRRLNRSIESKISRFFGFEPILAVLHGAEPGPTFQSGIFYYILPSFLVAVSIKR